MKKTLLMIQMAVCLFGFMACSSSDDDNIIQEMEQVAIKQSDLIGVWISGDYFVSFNNKWFYSAFLDDYFIDSGNYDINSDNNNVFTLNPITRKSTEYRIIDKTDNVLKAEISYTNMDGQQFKKTMSFTKSDKETAKERNNLVGNSWESLWYSDEGAQPCHYFVPTYIYGSMTTESPLAKSIPLTVIYVYLDNVMYYQLYTSQKDLPVIHGWNDEANTNKVLKYQFDTK